MKRLTALLLALLLSAALFTGCRGKTTPTAAPHTTVRPTPAPTTVPPTTVPPTTLPMESQTLPLETGLPTEAPSPTAKRR